MPFTPTHILAILPIAALKRLPLSFTALVIGSMIPDFPLFVPIAPEYETTHSARGVLTACLPLGLACFLVFQLLMKRPLFALLPVAIQRRCVSLSRTSIEPTPKALLGASLSVVIGASTHIFWDAFTHRGRWGTHVFPRLNETALTIWGHALPGFKLLQHGSTLVGLPCMLLLLAAWLYRRRPEVLGGDTVLSESSKAASYLIAVAIPVSVAFLVWSRDDLSRSVQLRQSITMSGLALITVTLAYCLAFHAVEGRMARAK
jgi:hypothetical protein